MLWLQGMKEDLELLSAEKDHLQEIGEELVGLIGEPDKPEVERGIEDLDTAFQALNDACDARQRALDDALQRATSFHDELNVSIVYDMAELTKCPHKDEAWLMRRVLKFVLYL